MFDRPVRLACIGGALLLAGCVTTAPMVPAPSATGAASWRAVAPAGTRRYPLALGEVASGATPVQRVTPVYPPSLLSACPPPVEVQALLIVDERGRVAEVRVAPEAPADLEKSQFTEAVRLAARRWTFNPLQKERWAADAEGNSHVVDSQTLPFSQAYVFRFQCDQGRGTVSTARRPPAGGVPAG
jgi:hypothetical protein